MTDSIILYRRSLSATADEAEEEEDDEPPLKYNKFIMPGKNFIFFIQQNLPTISLLCNGIEQRFADRIIVHSCQQY